MLLLFIFTNEGKNIFFSTEHFSWNLKIGYAFLKFPITENINKPWASKIRWHGYMPIIPAVGRQRQKDGEFKDSLGYTASSRVAWATQWDSVPQEQGQAGEAAPLVKHVPCKEEDLSSIPRYGGRSFQF